MSRWFALLVLMVAGWVCGPCAAFAQQRDSLAQQRDSLSMSRDSLGLDRDSLSMPRVSFRLSSDSLAMRQDSLLAGMRAAYRQLDYEQAEARGRAALADYDQLTPEQLIEIHTILAVVNYSTNDEEEARRHFEAALVLNPALSLDPAQFSPKILDFLQEVKAGMQPTPEPPPPAEPTVRYVTIVDPIPAAAVRSAVLPGWGQLYKGQRTKGRIILSIWGVTASGLAVSQGIYSHYVGQEGDADTQEEALRAYDRKNTWFRIRNNLALLAGGVWLYGYLDTILSDAPQPTIQIGEGVTASFRPGMSSLHVNLRF